MHVGDPRRGCLPDEEPILAGTGTVCAKLIHAERIQSGQGDEPMHARSFVGSEPTPKCKLGGGAPGSNGCPVDAAVGVFSKV